MARFGVRLGLKVSPANSVRVATMTWVMVGLGLCAKLCAHANNFSATKSLESGVVVSGRARQGTVQLQNLHLQQVSQKTIAMITGE